MLQQNEI